MLKYHKNILVPRFLPIAGGLALDDLKGPFQYKPFYDSMILLLMKEFIKALFKRLKLS